MRDCATTPTRSDTPAGLALEAAFDGGRLTSDGGLAWLAKADEKLGLCEALAEHVPEWRRGKARHPRWSRWSGSASCRWRAATRTKTTPTSFAPARC